MWTFKKIPGNDGNEQQKTHGLDFITKYLRTKHGVIFRLSNHVFQINFFDHTKLILSQTGQTVTYINAQREMTTKTLEQMLASNEKIVIDRIKFARDTAMMMLSKRQTTESWTL